MARNENPTRCTCASTCLRYRAYVPMCRLRGLALSAASLLYRLNVPDIAGVASWSIEKCRIFSKDWPKAPRNPAALLLISEIRGRLRFSWPSGSSTCPGHAVPDAFGRRGAAVHLTRALGRRCKRALRPRRAQRRAARQGPEASSWAARTPVRDGQLGCQWFEHDPG